MNLRLTHALSSRPAIGMMPGAEYGPAKQWPLECFHQLAARLIKEGFEVRVLGGAKDHAAGQAIVKGCRMRIIYAEKLSWPMPWIC